MFGKFVRSALPFKKFCEIEKISPNTFQYWRKELRKRDEERGVASKITKGDNRPSEFNDQVRHWREVLAALNEFEGSDREFCRNHGIPSGSLHYWRAKLKLLEEDTEMPAVDAAPRVMLPVKVVGKKSEVSTDPQRVPVQDQRIEIRLEHGRLLYLPSNTSMDLLIQLLNGLRGD
jgi:hypothetical protein